MVITAKLQTLPAAQNTLSVTEITLSEPFFPFSKTRQIRTFKNSAFRQATDTQNLAECDLRINLYYTITLILL
jgi:hypothetical protein